MTDVAIDARELTRTFGSFTAVDRITFDVRAGEVFGFLGANGAGKTTAIRMLTGLLQPSGGAATVAGHDVYKESEAIKRRIGYMFHQAFLVGAAYELDASGQITRHLFENLNTRFHQSSGAHKFISLLYGEISEDSTFRFLSAGHPFPAVFSNRHDRFMEGHRGNVRRADRAGRIGPRPGTVDRDRGAQFGRRP